MNVVWLGLIGLAMLSLGLYIRVGRFKTWYLVRGTPVVMPQALKNMLIPLGFSFLAAEIITSDLIPQKAPGGIEFQVVAAMFVISMVLGVWNPRWLRPRWLVYLEDEYGTLMWRLLREAAKNPREWERRVRTQQGLEEWAAETNARLGYPPYPGRKEREARERQRRMRSAKYKRTPEALAHLFEEKDGAEDKK